MGVGKPQGYAAGQGLPGPVPPQVLGGWWGHGDATWEVSVTCPVEGDAVSPWWLPGIVLLPSPLLPGPLLARPNQEPEGKGAVTHTVELSGQEPIAATWRGTWRGTRRQPATERPWSVWYKLAITRKEPSPTTAFSLMPIQTKMSIIEKSELAYPMAASFPTSRTTSLWTKTGSRTERDWSPLSTKNNPVYLQDHGAKLFIFVQLFGTGQDGGRLSGPRRTVEKQVWQSVFTDKLLNWGLGRKKLHQFLRAALTVGPQGGWKVLPPHD